MAFNAFETLIFKIICIICIKKFDNIINYVLIIYFTVINLIIIELVLPNIFISLEEIIATGDNKKALMIACVFGFHFALNVCCLLLIN